MVSLTRGNRSEVNRIAEHTGKNAAGRDKPGMSTDVISDVRFANVQSFATLCMAMSGSVHDELAHVWPNHAAPKRPSFFLKTSRL
jgi:hypothetical protein